MVKLREVGRYEWDDLWSRVENTNLLQSWEYGDAKSKVEWWKPVRFLILNDSGAPIGVAQLLVKTLPFIGGVARLNRGPLYLNPYKACKKTVVQSLHELKKECHRRNWWRLYIAPEIEDHQILNSQIAIGAIKLKNKISWASARLRLKISEDEILKNINGKWRNLLRKGKKSGVRVKIWEGDKSKFKNFLNEYSELQKMNGFNGVSKSLLTSLSRQKSDCWAFMLFFAVTEEDEIIGSVASIVHGDTATYLIGITNKMGRNLCANYLLLWNAILEAKKFGCTYYDLGGLNANTPVGISHFKLGLNPVQYQLIGELCL